MRTLELETVVLHHQEWATDTASVGEDVDFPLANVTIKRNFGRDVGLLAE